MRKQARSHKERKLEKQAQIMDATMHIFATKGYPNGTVSDIAQRQTFQ